MQHATLSEQQGKHDLLIKKTTQEAQVSSRNIGTNLLLDASQTVALPQPRKGKRGREQAREREKNIYTYTKQRKNRNETTQVADLYLNQVRSSVDLHRDSSITEVLPLRRLESIGTFPCQS